MVHGHVPASFMRGGTSKALMFHARDLPVQREDWDPIFLAAMGSPDPNGRQLNGMGGGVTSLSKVCVIGPPSRDDADVDYTFAQVQVKESRVSYAGNCGNMSAAVGPFSINEGLVTANGNKGVVRIHNTNTKKIIRSSFNVEGGKTVIEGDLIIPGVVGSGAPIRLDFLEPGGAGTGKLLPSGKVVDRLEVPGFGPVDVSLVDAANPCVFLDAASLGLSGIEMPEELERDTSAMARLHAIGAQASLVMGLCRTFESGFKNMPLVGLVSPPRNSVTLSGEVIPTDAADLCIRMLSSGEPHRALPGTGSICTAVAMRIAGTLPNRLSASLKGGTIRLAMPSGVMAVDAEVEAYRDSWHVLRGSVYRTARLLFKGDVYF